MGRGGNAWQACEGHVNRMRNRRIRFSMCVLVAMDGERVCVIITAISNYVNGMLEMKTLHSAHTVSGQNG